MNKKAIIAAFISSATFGAVLPEASAVDGTIYPGSNCERWGTGTPTIWYSSIGNTATVPLQIDCPVVRQETERPIASGSNVRVIDRHYSEDITCELLSVHLLSMTNGYIWASGVQRSTGSSANEQVLTLGSVGANSQSHHFLSCTIPPVYSGNASHLFSYKVEEST